MYTLMIAALLYCSSTLAQSSEQPPISVDQKSTIPTEAPHPEKAVVTTANAAVKGKVTKIYRDSKRVIVTLDIAISPATIPLVWEFTNSKSESCAGKTVESQDKNVFVDFSGCSNFEQISAGTIIYPPLFQNVDSEISGTMASPQDVPHKQPETKPASSTVGKKSRWGNPRFSVAVGFSGSNNLKFESVTFTNGSLSATGSEKFGVDTATQFSFLVMTARESSWGFQGGLTFESKRNVNSQEETAGGSTAYAKYSSPKPSIQFSIIEANALYRWDAVYLPFGLNYSMAEFKKGGDATTSITCTGRVGAQAGIGFIAGEHFHFEILYQRLSVSVIMADGLLSADLGAGNLSGGVVRAAVIF